jgi:hypothetical protein
MMRRELLPDTTSAFLRDQLELPISLAQSCDLFAAILPLYRQSYHPSSQFSMRPTVVYTPTPEFAVLSTSHIPKHTIVDGLTGVTLPIDQASFLKSPDARRSTINTGLKKYQCD